LPPQPTEQSRAAFFINDPGGRQGWCAGRAKELV